MRLRNRKPGSVVFGIATMDCVWPASLYRSLLLTMVILLGTAFNAPAAEARERLFCQGDNYPGDYYPCGGHLQPACNTGSACDAGHNSYSGPPLPFVADCPHIFIEQCFLGVCVTIVDENIPDVTVNTGCYDQIPTCNDCGGHLQPPCPESAEPVCGGCDDGLYIESLTGLCNLPGEPGFPCSEGAGCGDGLSCDGLDLTCYLDQPAQSGDSCGPYRPCDDGLECTIWFECATAGGGAEGEVCDPLSPCGEGLACSPGLPSRCVTDAKPGESCSFSQPCAAGSVCTTDFLLGSVCYPSPIPDPITDQQCESFYSEEMSRNAVAQNATITRSSGLGIVGVAGASFGTGVAYGANGEYGCFDTVCVGVDIDASIEQFNARGTYNEFSNIPGTATVQVSEGQVPYSPLNFGAGLVFSGGELTGSEAIFAFGIGVSPIPVALGVYTCETNLSAVYNYANDDGVVVTPLPTEPPGPAHLPNTSFGALQFDGVDDSLVLGDTTLLNTQTAGGELTVELWLNSSQYNQTATVISKAGEYEIGLENGELVYRLATTTTNWSDLVYTGIYTAQNFGWVHVALSYGSPNFVRLLVNGRELYADQAVGQLNDQDINDDRLVIGNSSSFDNPFRGQIDSVRLWAERRTPAQILIALNTQAPLADTTLIADWGFSEPGGSVLFDQSLNGLHLSLASDGTEPVRAGSERYVAGGVLAFDGIDDFAALGNIDRLASLEFDDVITIEAWVRPTGPGSHPDFGGIIVSKEGEYYIGRRPGGTMYLALANTVPGWSLVDTVVDLPENEWAHVAMTYDSNAGELIVYKNGVAEQVLSSYSGPIGDFHTTRNELRIGSRQNDTVSAVATRFEGLIDEVRIWNEAIDAPTIVTRYHQALNPDLHPGLRGYWRFDEYETNMLFDSRDRGLHVEMGQGNTWSVAQRLDAAAYADYPPGLLEPVCSTANCALNTDADLYSNYTDNCLLVANDTQADADLDGFGNACDPDFDNNNVVNFLDFVTLQNAFLSNDPLTDLNADGVVNFLDLVIFQQYFLRPPGPSGRVP